MVNFVFDSPSEFFLRINIYVHFISVKNIILLQKTRCFYQVFTFILMYDKAKYDLLILVKNSVFKRFLFNN